jgi:hypothetical protein
MTTTLTKQLPRINESEIDADYSRVPRDEMGPQHEDGWTLVLLMLAERFEVREAVAATK